MPKIRKSCGSCGNNFSQHIVDVIITPTGKGILSHPLENINHCLMLNKAEGRNDQKTF